jgi:hypothetical protein
VSSCNNICRLRLRLANATRRAVCAELVEAFELLRTARALTPRRHVGSERLRRRERSWQGLHSDAAKEDGASRRGFALAPHGVDGGG